MSALTIARAHPDSIAEGRLLTKIWHSTTEKPKAAPFPFRYRFERVEFDGLAESWPSIVKSKPTFPPASFAAS